MYRIILGIIITIITVFIYASLRLAKESDDINIR